MPAAGQHSTEVLHQRSKLPHSPLKLAIGGLPFVAVLSYFTLYTMKKPEARALYVAKVVAGVSTPEDTHPRKQVLLFFVFTHLLSHPFPPLLTPYAWPFMHSRTVHHKLPMPPFHFVSLSLVLVVFFPVNPHTNYFSLFYSVCMVANLIQEHSLKGILKVWIRFNLIYNYVNSCNIFIIGSGLTIPCI